MVKPEPWENPMLDTMWSFMQMGGLKANYPALKEACMELRQMLMKKTAGQRKDRPKDLSWENLERVKVTIICEAMALVLSGEYEGGKQTDGNVHETYVDSTDKEQRYFPKTDAVVTAPGCGHLMYGAITQINYGDTIQSTISGRRVPKFSIDQENDTRKTALKSRPLAAPKNYIPWIRAKNMVG